MGLATAVLNMIVMVCGYFFHVGIAKIVDLFFFCFSALRCNVASEITDDPVGRMVL